VSDGWSMGVLVYEFRALYEGFVRNEDPGLEEMKVQYKDFAVWQREWLQGEVLEKQLDYWRKQLAGMETLELPSDYERPAMASHRGGQIGFHWPKELVEKLKQLSRQEGMTLFMTLLAGFQVLLHRYSGQRDIVVGTDVSNRNRGQTEKLIGFFVNELVLRTEVTGELSFQEMLKQVRKVALGAYDHQDLPFEILVEDLQPERDLSRSPLFQVKMVMQNTPQETLQLEGLRLEPFDTAPGKAKLAEMFSFQDRPDEFLGTLAYQTDLFRRETMERMVEHLLIVMEEMAAHPERRITEFDYLSGAERKQVLEEWNPAKVAYRQDVCVHQLFTEQAEHMPGAVAVICQGQYLSYGELNRRANQLGAYLRELGVGPEVRVGLCMERSLEMVIGMLGVLKAGGAYIPLHASLPADRLTMMMEDSRPALLLTQSQLMKRLPSS
jgi:non-ribosomal peptide synthetase component F